MFALIMTLHILIALSLVGVILLQKSDGGGLTTSGSGGMGNFMNPRGTANILTKATIFLAIGFLATNITLVVYSAKQNQTTSITQTIEQQESDAPAAIPVPPTSDAQTTDEEKAVNKSAKEAKPANKSAPAVPVEN